MQVLYVQNPIKVNFIYLYLVNVLVFFKFSVAPRLILPCRSILELSSKNINLNTILHLTALPVAILPRYVIIRIMDGFLHFT